MIVPTATDKHVFVNWVSDDEFERIAAALGILREAILRCGTSVRFPRTIEGLSWKSYQQLLEALGDHRLRHIYAEGELKMSPRKDHDWVGRFLGRIVQAITFELDLPIQCIGSTTITSNELQRGFEPDEAFYLSNEPKVRGKMQFEPDVDPPPDLLIEVDVTNSSEERLLGFAVMGVPEVWRHEDDRTLIYVLSRDGAYQISTSSQAFPFLEADDLDRFVEMIGEMSENDVIREVMRFARERAS